MPPSSRGGCTCTNTFCAHTALPSQSVALQHRDTKIWLLESTISPVTKSRASWQQPAIEPSPLLETSTPRLSASHRAFCAPPNMELSRQETKKAERARGKAAALVYGLWPRKADSPGTKDNSTNIRAFLGNRMGKGLLLVRSARCCIFTPHCKLQKGVVPFPFRGMAAGN